MPGSEITEQIEFDWQSENVDAVFFTRYHGDHIGRFAEIPKNIPLYMGEVTYYSNGSKYWFSEDPCNNYTAGGGSAETTKTATVAATASSGSVSSGSYKWVLNTNTKRIHYPSCSSVNEMAEHNKAYSSKSVSQLEAEGYVPCGRCYPSD